MDATKQNKLNSTGANANITVSGSGNVITDITAADGAVTVTKGSIAATDYIKNGTNALDLTMASGESKDSMAPSITAVEGMKTTSVAEAGSTSNVKVPTETAVRSAIDTLNAALSGNIDAIKGLFEEGMGETAMNAYASWVEDGMKTSGEKYDALIAAIAADTKYHNVVTDDAKDHQNLIPRNSNITKGIAYALGTGIEHHTSNFDIDAEGVAQKTDTAWETIKRDKATDDYVPTVAAVERRVERAVTQAGNNISKETNNVLSSSNTTYLPTVAAVQATQDTTEVANQNNGTVTITAGTNTDDNHVPTSLTVKNDMATLATAINTKLNANTAITAKNNSIVNYDANGLVTGGVVFEDASGGLTGVNGETAGNMRCSASNPCVLTYLGGTGANAKYRWTAMDTENVTAQ